MERLTNEADVKREYLCGRTLGDYRLDRRIGGGATSDVFLAEQISLRRSVALKILKDELARDELYVKRFIQEARAAARLEHPNIVRIYEVGELIDEGEKQGFFKRKRVESFKTYRFIAQEYIDGMSLAHYLRHNGVASIEQTFDALKQVASALKQASDLGVVHRDVKPENILIAPSGTLKVVDFGLARLVDSRDADSWGEGSLTRAGIALGTPLYMSPEQAKGQKIDSRSDVYSLGITAYRMLTGTPPFSGDTPLAVVLKHLNETPRPITELRPDVPTELAAIVHRMIEKDPKARPQTLDELLTDLNLAEQKNKVQIEPFTLQEKYRVETLPDEDLPSTTIDDATSTEIASQGFLQTNQERENFRRVLQTTNISREWSVNCARLEKTKRLDSQSFWTKRSVIQTSVLFGSALALGGLVPFLCGQIFASKPQEPPLAIRKLDTVEEQYVCALQLETPDAWKSVVEYFPQDKYWVDRARRQLAVSYVDEKNIEEAEKVFRELDADSDPLALVGLAWCAASREDYDKSAAIISELTDSQKIDRLTFQVLTKTWTLLHQRVGDRLPDAFRRFAPFDRKRDVPYRERRKTNNRPNADVNPPFDFSNDRDFVPQQFPQSAKQNFPSQGQIIPPMQRDREEMSTSPQIE